MKFIQTAKMILSLLPAIIEAIRAIEAVMPEGGRGKEKLAIVKAAIDSAAVAADGTMTAVEAVWPAISNTISTIVGVFNATGVFPKK